MVFPFGLHAASRYRLDRLSEHQKAVYGLSFKPPTETVGTIAADPKRFGPRAGMTSVLHTCGSAMTDHRHVQIFVPGRCLSPYGIRWVACEPNLFLHVQVLSRQFRRLFFEGLMTLQRAGGLAFIGDLERLVSAVGLED